MTHPSMPQDDRDARIAALEAELAALRSEMQDFTYTVSHDLRASLRHVLSYATLVQEDAGPQLSEEVQGFLVTISESARHMGAQMDALLDLSRVGTAPLQLQVVELAPLLDAVRDELLPVIGTRNIQWTLAPEWPSVRADPALLHQALLQVLGNAVKFTAQRPLAQIHLTVHTDLAAGTVRMTVQDNGVGFNPALQSRLFHAFQRLHSAKQFAGLGMGLALARKSLRRMGGDITAEGVLDGGCTVTLRLPLAQGADPT